MTERRAKLGIAAAALLLVLPATLALVLLAILAYPRPPQSGGSLQIAFDAAMLLQLCAAIAAWRLIVPRLGGGRAALQRAHPAWLVVLGIGALVGMAGAAAAIEHAMNLHAPTARVGFALLSPAVLFAPVWWMLFRERRARGEGVGPVEPKKKPRRVGRG